MHIILYIIIHSHIDNTENTRITQSNACYTELIMYNIIIYILYDRYANIYEYD